MFCVIAKLNEEARQELLRVQGVVETFGLERRHLHGHITLATFVRGSEVELIAHCKEELRGLQPFSVLYSGIGEFTDTCIVVALLEKTPELLSVQRMVTKGHDEMLDQWTHNESWQPHTTLVHQPGMKLERIAEAMQTEFKSFEAWIEWIEFSRVTDNGYVIVDQVELK